METNYNITVNKPTLAQIRSDFLNTSDSELRADNCVFLPILKTESSKTEGKIF